MNSVVATIADLQKKLSTNSFHGHDKMQLYYDCFSQKAPWHAKVTRVTRVTRVNMFKFVFDELKNSSSSCFSMLSPILVAPNLQGEFAQTSTRPGKADQSESLHGSLVFGNVGHHSVFVLNVFDKVACVFVVNGRFQNMPTNLGKAYCIWASSPLPFAIQGVWFTSTANMLDETFTRVSETAICQTLRINIRYYTNIIHYYTIIYVLY